MRSTRADADSHRSDRTNEESVMTYRRDGRRLYDRVRRGIPAVATAVALLVVLAGCESLLDVESDPNEVPGDQLAQPSSFQARLVGTQADFFFAYDMASAWGGLFTDELIDGTGFDEVDERRVTASNATIGAVDEAPEGLDGLWTPMQKAAFTSDLLQDDILANSFPEQVPNPANSPELALTSMISGYAKMTLGEMFCTTAFGGDGPELSSQETYALAEDEFTQAIDADNATTDVLRAALVGRARARLLQGNTSGALTDAQQVPVDWAFVADVYSTNSQQEENDLWNMLSDSQRFSVDPDYRALDIDATTEDDPRVEAFQDPDDQFASDGSTELFQLDKYIVATAPIVLASGHEAAYYVAEIEGGQTAEDMINAVRDDIGTGGDDGDGRGQGDLAAQDYDSSGDTAEEILLKVFDERARTLFLTGKRMGDLRRLLDQEGINLFPTGPNFGDQTCMPLPNAERDNNPDI